MSIDVTKYPIVSKNVQEIHSKIKGNKIMNIKDKIVKVNNFKERLILKYAEIKHLEELENLYKNCADESVYCLIVEEKLRVKAEAEELMKVRNKISVYISNVFDDKKKELLERYCLHDEDVHAVSKRFHYSRRHADRLIYGALAEMAEFIEIDSNKQP